MRINSLHIVVALIGSALSGCSHLSGLGGSAEFKCQAPEGVPCMSVSGVAANDRAGTLPGSRANASDTTENRDRAAKSPVHTVALPNRPKPIEASPRTGAIRSDPTVIRVWIAPWEDSDGDLNDQAYVYLQTDSGRWLIEHNRERIRREFAPKPAQVAEVKPVPTHAAPVAPAASALPQWPAVTSPATVGKAQ